MTEDKMAELIDLAKDLYIPAALYEIEHNMLANAEMIPGYGAEEQLAYIKGVQAVVARIVPLFQTKEDNDEGTE